MESPETFAAKSAGRFRILPWVLMAIPWLALVNYLRLEWTVNEQYGYGFVVPLLAIYLAMLRWNDRPEPEHFLPPLLLVLIATALAMLYAPLRLVAESTPDWRAIGWLLAVITTGLTACLVAFVGGMKWLRHFSFPIFFILVAVPWPMPWENRIVSWLVHSNAMMAADVVNLFGVYAVVHENVIQLSSGFVGVDDACSGVRSLQTTLMMSLFFGEWFRFHVLRRLLLIGVGALLAFGCNFLRVLFLTAMCARSGENGVEAWHDPAGWLVVGATFCGLWMTAKWLAGGREEATLSGASSASTQHASRSWPFAAMASLVIWYGLVEAGTQAWYGWHESHQAAAVRWDVAWPKYAADFRVLPIPETTRTMLKYQRGSSVTWVDESGSARWNGYFFRWEPSHTSAILARSHRPDICLPATGREMVTDFGVSSFRIGDLEIPFRIYQFSDQGEPLFVFYCAWEDRHPSENKIAPEQKQANRIKVINRLQAVQEGRRNQGQQVLEIALWGRSTAEEARATFARELQQLIVPLNKP